MVSVLMACYNKAPYLAEALDSLLKQSYTDWECILINDGSTDNSEEIALNYAERDKRIRYFYQENQGVIRTRNNAFPKARGEFIIPFDSDDVLEKEYLERTLSEIENGVDVCYTKASYIGDKNGIDPYPPFDIKSILKENIIVSCAALMKREVFEKVGGYCPDFVHGIEDWDFWLSAYKAGYSFKRIPEALLRYRFVASSRSNNLKSLQSNVHSMRNLIMSRHIDLYQTVEGNFLDIYRYYIATQSTYRKIMSNRFIKYQILLLKKLKLL